MIEYVAVGFGFAYILLAIQRHRACWIAGGVSTSLFVWVFVDAGLPLQAGLQILYVLLSIYGWIAWRPDAESAARIRSWPLSRHLIAIVGVGVATAVSASLLAGNAWSDSPIADSLGSWASLVATWLLARRYIDNWIWWIVIDAGLSVLFASRGLYLTAALYLAFTLLAIAGWRTWRRSVAVPS